MHINEFHSWRLKPKEAIAVQRELAGKVDRSWRPRTIKRIAGIDSAFIGDSGISVVSLLDFETLELIDSVSVSAPVMMPYIPGLLSFREIPVAIKAFEKLNFTPDLIYVDGQGRLHPRRLGFASHLGLMLDIPTIGCAKSLLCGQYAEPGNAKGERAEVVDKGEVIGVALRSRADTKAIYVSIGHMITLDKAVELTLAVCPKYRIPEPIRHADRLAGLAKETVADD